MEQKEQGIEAANDMIPGPAELTLNFSNGKAELKFAYAPAGAGASISLDSLVLVDLIFGAIEKASPPGMVGIEESVKVVLKKAIAEL